MINVLFNPKVNNQINLSKPSFSGKKAEIIKVRNYQDSWISLKGAEALKSKSFSKIAFRGANSEIIHEFDQEIVNELKKVLPNFYQVEGKLYKSAALTTETFKIINKNPEKVTVIDLRKAHERLNDYLNGLKQSKNIDYHNVPIVLLEIDNPYSNTKEKLKEIFQAVNNATGPVIIHCSEGKDRTGFVLDIFKVLIQKKTGKTAVAETSQLGCRSLPPILLERSAKNYL